MKKRTVNELTETSRRSTIARSKIATLTPRFRFNRSNEFAKIRGKLGLSQSRFAAMLGVSKETLQNWEQGRREPTAAARLLLRVAAKHPDILLKVAKAA